MAQCAAAGKGYSTRAREAHAFSRVVIACWQFSRFSSDTLNVEMSAAASTKTAISKKKRPAVCVWSTVCREARRLGVVKLVNRTCLDFKNCHQQKKRPAAQTHTRARCKKPHQAHSGQPPSDHAVGGRSVCGCHGPSLRRSDRRRSLKKRRAERWNSRRWFKRERTPSRALMAPISPPPLWAITITASERICSGSSTADQRGTKEMVQPCLVQLHVTSLVAAARHQRDDATLSCPATCHLFGCGGAQCPAKTGQSGGGGSAAGRCSTADGHEASDGDMTWLAVCHVAPFSTAAGSMVQPGEVR